MGQGLLSACRPSRLDSQSESSATRACVRTHSSRDCFGMILILIFAEALGLYGLIVGLVVASTASVKGTDLCTSFK